MMRSFKIFSKKPEKYIHFLIIIILFTLIGAFLGKINSAEAATPSNHASQLPGYVGPEFCGECHEDLVDSWSETRHAFAFSSPIFQRDWSELGSKTSCLECHTTGYDATSGAYSFEGVTCESCHGTFQPDHPQKPMPITPDAELCATCHKQTTDEWQTSKHREMGIQCQSCHNPHSQTPMAESITALCTNCHKDRETSFTHSTHANSGLQCSNCHMYTSPRTEDPIEGLVPTGHTFTVGSEACIGCHQDTVHSRDEIIKLSGQIQESTEPDIAELSQKVQDQELQITSLEEQSSIRLYTGLAQGSIIGLITGAVVAWVVSKGIKVVEEEDE